MRSIFVALALVSVLLFAACSKRDGSAKGGPSPDSAAASTAAGSPAAQALGQEPPEDVLRDLMFRQYAALDAMGGLPVTVTATGRAGKLRARLYSVRKNKCEQGPPQPPGVFECHVDLMAALWWDGQREPRKPLPDSKRISVVQDAQGVWIDCSYSRGRDSICSRGIAR